MPTGGVCQHPPSGELPSDLLRTCLKLLPWVPNSIEQSPGTGVMEYTLCLHTCAIETLAGFVYIMKPALCLQQSKRMGQIDCHKPNTVFGVFCGVSHPGLIMRPIKYMDHGVQHNSEQIPRTQFV